ncbi:hypothetical protein EXIGLDRAFT_33087 [Exidia glandulosa HHB12029]|uniref:Concanavalin A-like lectin/glucanase n=1 Tax=Exidia glandulosa HHB12029 TaxID=1314781 RepID=A0A165ISP4_EXIGL|nr:hypothetical protein EXIGLDRAFT_33087 [Exidia glandulosa HHB12029]
MFALTLFTLLASPLFASAAPTDANVALARKYAPQFKFHKDEKYFGSSVEYFLNGPITVQDGNGATVSSGGLTTTTLDDFPDQGNGLYMSTSTSKEAKAGFLAGQDPSKTQDAKVYTFIAPKANGVVDLYYWLFTPYNLAKDVPLLGEVGNHIGDWERLSVRTVNGTATQVDYHAHSDTGAGTIPWANVVKFDNDQRPVGYVASGSHGFWAKPGTFTYVNAVIFKLQDVTSDDGVAWDTRDSLVTINYPDTYTGDLEWLNYRGTWGNKGTDKCWWHFIYKDCELVTGPTGPLRGDVLGAAFAKGKTNLSTMVNSAFSHTLATVRNSHSSSFTFHAETAEPYVAVKQVCSAGDGNVEHKVTNIDVSADGKSASVVEAETVTRYGSVLANGSKFTVSVGSCPEGTSVASYTIGACSSGAVYSCNWASETRAIRAFSSDPSVQDAQAVRAVTVDDLDVWQL